MRHAAWVERRGTFRAFIDALVRLDRQFSPAHSAEDGGLVSLFARPLLCGVVRSLGVAQVAGIVAVAAGESNGDDIEFGGVVDAPRVFVDRSAEYFGGPRHCSPILPARRD